MDALTVFVIENDDAVRDSLTLLLSAEGLGVMAFASAEAFLSPVSGPTSGPIPGLVHGCILADVQMAGVDGVALLGRLRRRGLALPVILMTGRPGADLSAKALSEGVTILDKPFTSDALLDALQSAVSRRH